MVGFRDSDGEKTMPPMVGVIDIDDVGGNGLLLVAASAGDETAIDTMEAAVRVRAILNKIHPQG